MNVVPPNRKAPISRVTIDDIAFYYSQNCKVMPQVHSHYIDSLTLLERQGKICFTPEAILERYHINYKRRITERVRKVATR